MPHPRFQVVGKDLVHRARIGLVDALVGFERKLTLPTGRVLRVLHHGGGAERIVFRGEGLPPLGQSVPSTHTHAMADAAPEPAPAPDPKRGDVIVEFDVSFPRRLGDTELRALREQAGMDGAELAMLEMVVRLAASKDEDYRPDATELAHAGASCDLDPLLCVADPLAFLDAGAEGGKAGGPGEGSGVDRGR